MLSKVTGALLLHGRSCLSIIQRATVQSTGLSQQPGKPQPAATLVLTQQGLPGRKKAGKEEASVGRCQGGQSMSGSPGPLSSAPGGNVGSGKGAVHSYRPLWGRRLMCVLLWCVVHNTRLLGCLHLRSGVLPTSCRCDVPSSGASWALNECMVHEVCYLNFLLALFLCSKTTKSQNNSISFPQRLGCQSSLC